MGKGMCQQTKMSAKAACDKLKGAMAANAG
jgi:hypothetical protein